MSERTALVHAEFCFGTPHERKFGGKEAQMGGLY